MKRLYLLSILMLIMAVTMLPQNTKAQAPVWDGTWETWTQGSGTQADPYLIETPQHLAWLARTVNNDDSTYSGKYFRLTSNIDLYSLDWTPIGKSTTKCFKGHFDGDNHIIDNIRIVVSATPTNNGVSISNDICGFFGIIDNATIENLRVYTTIAGDGYIYSNGSRWDYPYCAGGLVGYIYNGNNIITNCYSNGVIKGIFSGGLIGYMNEGTTTITDCHNNGQVTGKRHMNHHSGSSPQYESVGGICGYIHNTISTLTDCSNSGIISNSFGNSGGLIGLHYATVTINNSQNNGNIVADQSVAGGLVGFSCNYLNIANSNNTGNISGGCSYAGGLAGYSKNGIAVTSCYNSGNLSSGSNTGGLVGYAENSLAITYSYNMGSINVGGISSKYSGGLIGYNKASSNISHSFNTGNITLYASNSSSNSYNVYSGGIAGYSEYNSIFVEQCYNSGVISCNSEGYGYAGGVVGYVDGGTNNIKECYNVGNVTGKTSCGGILGYNKAGTSIANCYNVGSLTTSNIVGGIYCYETNYQPIASNCYFLNACGGSANTGSQSLTSAQMKSSSFPGMLNVGVQAYTMDGNPNVNQGYPIFGDMVYAVSTQNATNVGVTRATLHGNYVGGADMVGFQYRENTTGSAWNTVYATVGSPVSYLLTGLQSNTGYVFRFMVENNGGVYYGEEKTFTTGTCNLTASVSPSSVTICQGETATVTASGQSSLGNQFSYSWNTGETTPTINVFGGGERVVTVSDSNGCSTTASVNVTVNPLPTVAISGNTTLCTGESSLLTASGGSSYVWNTGATIPSITVSNGGIYSVTATNTYSCSSSATVQVISLENVSISGNLNICQGQSTTLYANGTGSYLWNTGATTSSVTVTQAGLYTVTVSLGNCSSSASASVSVATNPVPTISGNTTICQGETSLLIANGGNSYVWSNGNASNSIGVSQSGTYSVTATSMEGCTGSTSVFVTVNPLPNVSISGNNSFCQGDDIMLTATGANTYVWSNTSSNASITVSNAGNYTVTGTDGNGCSNTATKAVSVNPTYNTPLTHSMCEGESYNFYGQNITTAGTYTHMLQTVNGCDSIITITLTIKNLPTPSILGNTVICQGQSTTLTANGGTSYVWSNASTNSSITVNQSGVYTVTATNAEGCSNTANVTVTVNPLPNVTISGNTTVCAGSSTTLTASGANSYSWSTGDNTASVNIDAFGVYTVTGTSTEGCSNTASVTVLVSQLPNITITGETDICAGESTTLTANGGETYLWSDGTTDNTLTVSTAGTYQVIGYNAAGCNAMASATVTVWQPAASEFSVECPDSCYTWNAQTYCTSGDYTQTFQTVHGCDSVVTLHLTITVGIDDHHLGASMTVYPNPTTGMVNVQCTMNNTQAEKVEFQLFDAFGRLLRTTDGVGANNDSPLRTDGHGSSVQTQIDLSHYASGTYFIKAVADGNVVAVRKVVKR